MLRRIFQRHIAIPTDHGSWVFLLSPLMIGIFAARTYKPATGFLIICALCVFLVRQPLSIAVKSLSGRRSKRDLMPAVVWAFVYSVIGALSALWLLSDYSFILLLAIPGIPVFAFHLYLIYRRAERRQMGIEIVASGALALAAPAAYWVGIGHPEQNGWWLFILCWLQSAASIVYAYLRLNQRDLQVMPSMADRFLLARRALLYTGFNVILAAFASVTGILPKGLLLPFGLQFIEAIWGTINPAIGWKPTKIGIRQLIVSTIFTALFIITWNKNSS